jgi:uncharacterized membrane protein YoaK (UPF0700 family)
LPVNALLSGRNTLLMLLAFATGATDAAAFVHLGHVFASVITGNLVVLGVSVLAGDHHLTLFAGCALIGYSSGVLVAAPRRERQPTDPGWPPRVTAALRGELVLLALFAIGWELAGHSPSVAWDAVLLFIASAAMGVQSTAVRRLGQISTTYLTSTLTGLLEDLRARRRPEGQGRSVGILVTALLGAAVATAVILHARVLLPGLQLVPVAAVIVVSTRVRGPRAARTTTR